ncbi:hypothetical protein ACWD3J_40020 [Streptomyces sp. NPDC002755]
MTLPSADDPVVTSSRSESASGTSVPFVFPSSVTAPSAQVAEAEQPDRYRLHMAGRAEAEAGDPVERGLPRAVLATGQDVATAADRPSGPGHRAGGKPLLVAAAFAGAVLTSIPFLTHHGGKVNYEGLGQQVPVASQAPDASGVGAARPDGQANVMPLQDPARGTAAPVIPQPEASSSAHPGQEGHTPGTHGPSASAEAPVSPRSETPLIAPLHGAAGSQPSHPDASGAAAPTPRKQPTQHDGSHTLAGPTAASVPVRNSSAHQVSAAGPKGSVKPSVPSKPTTSTSSSKPPSHQTSTASSTTAHAAAAVPVTAQAAAPAQPARAARTWNTRVVSATTVLGAGEHVESDRMRITMRTDGNLVVTDENGQVRWSSHTAGRGSKAVFQNDGNLVVYTADNQTAWSSGTAGNPGAKLVIQNDGNVTILSSGDALLWSANTQH